MGPLYEHFEAIQKQREACVDSQGVNLVAYFWSAPGQGPKRGESLQRNRWVCDVCDRPDVEHLEVDMTPGVPLSRLSCEESRDAEPQERASVAAVAAVAAAAAAATASAFPATAAATAVAAAAAAAAATAASTAAAAAIP